MNDLEMRTELEPVVSTEDALSLIKAELRKIIDDALLNAYQNTKSLVKQFDDHNNKLGETIANNNKTFTNAIAELNLVIETLAKIPVALEQKITAIAPKIAEKIVENHNGCSQEFINNINECNNTLGNLKQNALKFQRWHAKRMAVICIAATIIAMIASGSSTC